MKPIAGERSFPLLRRPAVLAGILLLAILGPAAGGALLGVIGDGGGAGTPEPTASAALVEPPTSEGFSVLPAPPVPEGRAVLSSSNASKITELGRFGRGWPSSLDYSPDGTRMAVGSSRGAEILHIDGWRSQAVYASSSQVLTVRFSPGGEWLAVGQQDGAVILLDAETAAVRLRLISHAHPVRGLAFSGSGPDGSAPALLASGAEDGMVVVWDLASGTARQQFWNPLLGYWGYGIRSLAFSPDQRILVTGGDQGYLSRWDLETGEELPRLQTQHGLLFGIAFSPDGSLLASACGDGTVQIWDYASEEPLALLQGHAYGAWSVAWTGDGKNLAAGAGDGTVKIWNPSSGTLRREMTVASTKIDLVRYSPDDTTLAAVSAAESAFLLDAGTLKTVHNFADLIGGLRSAAFSPGGEWAALAGGNGTAYLWNLARGEGFALGKARPQSNAEVAALFSPDGEVLAVADGLPGVLRFYDMESLALRREVRAAGVRAAAFSPDGRLLATGGIGGLQVWTADTLESREIDSPYRLDSLAFASVPETEENFLAGGLEDGSVLLWTPPGFGEPVRLAAVGNRDPVWELAASGSLLAAGDDRGDVRIWNVGTGDVIRSFSGYSGSIFALAISPDQSLLAAGGIQGSFRIWSIATGRMLRIVRAHNGWVTGLAFSADGRWLLSAGSDGIGRIWGI